MVQSISSRQYIIGSILLLLLMYIFIYIPLNIYPAEDAAILFQFSENFSQTGSITYIKNGPPAEGATDFLWMVILGCIHFLGMEVYLASTILSMIALTGTAFLLFKISNTKNINYFLLLLFILIFLPMTPAAIQGFSPLFFGFFIILTTYYFLKNSPEKFYISALFLCLVRPDGVIFALPLIVLYLSFNVPTIKISIKKLLIYFMIPGLIYFAWRWNYFGEFLPLPFYVKSNFERHFLLFNISSLKQNLVIVGVLFSPIIIFIISALFHTKTDKKILALFIAIVVVPFIFYSSMALDQNVSHRFQYSIVLGLLIIFSYILRVYSNKKIIVLIFISQTLLMLPLSIKNHLSLLAITSEQITYIAKELNEITTSASMAITEAGRLPYYSKWNAVDMWGLNTPEYAKKLIQPNDIKLINPDLMVVHSSKESYKLLENKQAIPTLKKRSWSNMTNNIFKGIDMNSYTLYMVPFKYQNNRFSSKLYYKLELTIRNHLNIKPKVTRYDAYFIKKSFKFSQNIIDLLKKYHAITYKEFNVLNNPKQP